MLRLPGEVKLSAGPVSRNRPHSVVSGTQPAPTVRSESGRRADSTRMASAPNSARLRQVTGAATP